MAELATAAMEYLNHIAERCEGDAKQILGGLVAQIVERYRAASAWVFLYSPHRTLSSALDGFDQSVQLRCVIGHNADINAPSNSTVNTDGTNTSMAAQCVADGTVLVYPHIISRFGKQNYESYLHSKKSTRSAVAVPIIFGSGALPDKSNIAGVLVVEATEPYLFSYSDGCEIFNDARALCGALLYLRQCHEGLHSSSNWFPQTIHWNVSDGLNQLCYAVASSVPHKKKQPEMGITVWWSDENGIDGGYAYALAAIRFDPDYLCQRTLETFRRKDDQVTPASLVGHLLCSVPGTYLHKAWQDIKWFVRAEKAQRAELDYVFATNLADGADFVDTVNDRGIDDYRTEYVKQNCGVLTCYTYHGTTDNLRRCLSAPFLRQFARLIERVLFTNRRTLAEAARAGLDSRLRTLGLTSENSFNIIRDFLMEIFQAAGCSIFAVEETRASVTGKRSFTLQCVATSGLVINGNEIRFKHAEYDLPLETPDDITKHDTVNVVLKSVQSGHPRISVFRINRRTKWIRDRLPPSRILESIGLTDLEHRRSMFFVVWPEGGKTPLGVVRVIRSARERPFTVFDERTIESLNSVIAEAFLRHNAQCQGRLSFQVTELRTQYANLWKDDPKSGREEGYSNAVVRLLEAPTQFQAWTRRRIEAVLQDLFFAFDALTPVLAMFRVVVPDGHRSGSLRVMATHAHSFLELPEGAIKGISEGDGGIGWDCINQRQCIHFRRDDGDRNEDRGFTPTFAACQEFTRQGLCIPILIPFQNSPTMGVLSIEVHSEEAISPSEWALATAAAFQIANAAVDQDNPSFFLDQTFSNNRQSNPATDVLAKFRQRVSNADWSFCVQIFGENGLLSSEEFSPSGIGILSDAENLLDIASTVANRTVPPEAYPANGDVPPVTYGRIPIDLETDLNKLRTLGCQVNLKTGEFRLPLWLGPVQCGAFFGQPRVPPTQSPEEVARTIFRFIKEASGVWTSVGRRSPVLVGSDPHWSVKREKQASPLPSTTRTEWRLLGQFGGDWMTEVEPANNAD